LTGGRKGSRPACSRVMSGRALTMPVAAPHTGNCTEAAGLLETRFANRREVRMADGFVIAKFRDVADGLQAGQFAVGERRPAARLNDLDPMFRQLLDRPITQTLGITGPDGRPSLTPMWFDHENDKILVNTASHREKCQWIRNSPRMTSLLVNPDNPYHWIQIRHSVEKELREWEA